MSDGNGGYNFLAGFFVGAALGAMAALLFTPKTGKEMRDTLSEEGRRLRDKTDQAVTDLKGRGEEVYGKERYTGSPDQLKDGEVSCAGFRKFSPVHHIVRSCLLANRIN